MIIINKELVEAITEINVILSYMSKDILDKIPKDIQQFFKDNSNSEYSFKYNKNKPLNKQVLKPATKGIIALLYRDYICDENERAEYIQIYNEFLKKEEQGKLGFNANELFEVNKNSSTQNDIIPVVNANKRWYTKIWGIIKKYFK